MKAIFKDFYDEHQELYSELDIRLKELSKNKKEIDKEHLFTELKKLLSFTESLLNEHFCEEDKIYTEFTDNLIPGRLKELFNKIKADHIEINEKYQKLDNAYQNQKDLDSTKDILQKQLLFPSYNLIATINHHAQREDKFFQDLRDW